MANNTTTRKRVKSGTRGKRVKRGKSNLKMTKKRNNCGCNIMNLLNFFKLPQRGG